MTMKKKLENITGLKILNVMFNYSADVILPKKRKNQLMDIYSIENICLDELDLKPVMEIQIQNNIVHYYNVNGILYSEAGHQDFFNKNLKLVQQNDLLHIKNYEYHFPKKETKSCHNINCGQKILKDNLENSKILSHNYDVKKKQFHEYFKDFVYINGKICYPCPLPLYTLRKVIRNNEQFINLFTNKAYAELYSNINYSIKHKHLYITDCFPIFDIENHKDILKTNTIKINIFNKEFLKEYYEMSYEKNMFFSYFVKDILDNPIFKFNETTIEDLQKLIELKNLIQNYNITEQNNDINAYILKTLEDVSSYIISNDSFPIEFIGNHINNYEEKIELTI